MKRKKKEKKTTYDMLEEIYSVLKLQGELSISDITKEINGTWASVRRALETLEKLNVIRKIETSHKIYFYLRKDALRLTLKEIPFEILSEGKFSNYDEFATLIQNKIKEQMN